MRLPLAFCLALAPAFVLLAPAAADSRAEAPASTPAPPSANPTAPPVFPLTRVVPKGEMRAIAFFAYLYPDCSSQGAVVVRLLEPPKHGKTAFIDIDSFPRFGVGTPLAPCNAKKTPGVRMTYEAEDGFEGLDAYRILTINPDGTAAEYEVKVSVR